MALSEILLVLLLGVVEGVTEFLPVSSTGHLILTEHFLEYSVDSTHFFDIFIQLGAILAVICLYWRRFINLIPSSDEVFKDIVRKGEGINGFVGLIKIALACSSAFVLGFILHDIIKEKLFAPVPVAAALVAGGLVMWLVERSHAERCGDEIEGVSYRQAFLIGLVQCLALWPGVSRAGATIIGGMLFGLSRKAAAEFSFLVAVPVMLAATCYDFLKSYSGLTMISAQSYVLGFICSFITAIIAIKFMMAIISRFSFIPFAIYRILLGILVLCLLF
ncbi:MAG: undecaprenyl-diphosphate phosphatase [Deltaproteobacteria bacterium]|nr:undecaprenyl-diphosphate phosphatase [Deltaproteobacteria bacterium]